MGIDPLLFVVIFAFSLILMFAIDYSAAVPMSSAVLFPILYGLRIGGDLTLLLTALAVSTLIVYKFLGNLVKAICGDDMRVRENIQDHLFRKNFTTKD